MPSGNRRRNVRARLSLRVALERGNGNPWLSSRHSDGPVKLAPSPKVLEGARQKLTKATQRTVSLSTGGLGLTVASGSDILPHDRVMALVALGPKNRPLDTVAGIPARVVRTADILDGLEVGLAFEAEEPAIDRRLTTVIQDRKRQGRRGPKA